ncbi:hypothetical protein JXA88_03875 [Candidatus Fermentibacteria bacterium]|nr:hypothetical protein [Candidatus Fermentibacteria bacterium]
MTFTEMRNNPDLTVFIDVQDYCTALDESGVGVAGPTPEALGPGMMLMVSDKDVEAFKGAWEGQGVVSEGQRQSAPPRILSATVAP